MADMTETPLEALRVASDALLRIAATLHREKWRFDDSSETGRAAFGVMHHAGAEAKVESDRARAALPREEG